MNRNCSGRNITPTPIVSGLKTQNPVDQGEEIIIFENISRVKENCDTRRKLGCGLLAISSTMLFFIGAYVATQIDYSFLGDLPFFQQDKKADGVIPPELRKNRDGVTLIAIIGKDFDLGKITQDKGGIKLGSTPEVTAVDSKDCTCGADMVNSVVLEINKMKKELPPEQASKIGNIKISLFSTNKGPEGSKNDSPADAIKAAVEAGADIIILDSGDTPDKESEDPSLTAAINQATANGVSIFAPSNKEGAGGESNPGINSDVISVVPLSDGKVAADQPMTESADIAVDVSISNENNAKSEDAPESKSTPEASLQVKATAKAAAIAAVAHSFANNSGTPISGKQAAEIAKESGSPAKDMVKDDSCGCKDLVSQLVIISASGAINHIDKNKENIPQESDTQSPTAQFYVTIDSKTKGATGLIALNDSSKIDASSAKLQLEGTLSDGKAMETDVKLKNDKNGLSFFIPNLPEGKFSLQLSGVSDAAGNEMKNSQRSLNNSSNDNTPPQVETKEKIINLSNGSNEVNIDIDAADSETSISNIQITLNNKQKTDKNYSATSNEVTNNISVNSKELSEGDNLISIKVYDLGKKNCTKKSFLIKVKGGIIVDFKSIEDPSITSAKPELNREGEGKIELTVEYLGKFSASNITAELKNKDTGESVQAKGELKGNIIILYVKGMSLGDYDINVTGLKDYEGDEIEPLKTSIQNNLSSSKGNGGAVKNLDVLAIIDFTSRKANASSSASISFKLSNAENIDTSSASILITNLSTGGSFPLRFTSNGALNENGLNMEDGRYKVSIDGVKQKNTGKTIGVEDKKFTVDSKAPSLNFTYDVTKDLNNNTGNIINFAGIASDELGVTSLEYQLNGTSVKTENFEGDNTRVGSYKLKEGELKEGVLYIFSIGARDEAGNYKNAQWEINKSRGNVKVTPKNI